MCGLTAVGLRRRRTGVAVSELDGGQRHPEADDVRQHVAGVAEQRQRVRQPPGDGLDDQDDGAQRERDRQPLAVPGPRPGQSGTMAVTRTVGVGLAVPVAVVAGHDSTVPPTRTQAWRASRARRTLVTLTRPSGADRLGEDADPQLLQLPREVDDLGLAAGRDRGS